MQKYDLVVKRYWVNQSGYFILATKVAFGMGIIDGNIIFCNVISEVIVDNKIDITTKGWFINTKIIPFHMIVVA